MIPLQIPAFERPEQWTKGSFINLNDDGSYSYCLTEWVSRAFKGEDRTHERGRAITALVQAAYPIAVFTFNDRQETTFADVQEVIRKANERLAKEV